MEVSAQFGAQELKYSSDLGPAGLGRSPSVLVDYIREATGTRNVGVEDQGCLSDGVGEGHSGEAVGLCQVVGSGVLAATRRAGQPK